MKRNILSAILCGALVGFSSYAFADTTEAGGNAPAWNRGGRGGMGGPGGQRWGGRGGMGGPGAMGPGGMGPELWAPEAWAAECVSAAAAVCWAV